MILLDTNVVSELMRSEPERERTWFLDRIAPGSEHEVSDTGVELDIERLAGLNEAEVGELELRVDGEGIEPVVERRRIELLARDEWGGVSDMPQLLAAFVSPNEPVVAKLLKSASELLRAKGHDGAMDGYQSGDPSRALHAGGAIWSAATALGLTYAEPPASFESEGQKTRGPARIAGQEMNKRLLTLFRRANSDMQEGGTNTLFLAVGCRFVGQRSWKMVKNPLETVGYGNELRCHGTNPVGATVVVAGAEHGGCLPTGRDKPVPHGSVVPRTSASRPRG